jgi:hypothetical protein
LAFSINSHLKAKHFQSNPKLQITKSGPTLPQMPKRENHAKISDPSAQPQGRIFGGICESQARTRRAKDLQATHKKHFL